MVRFKHPLKWTNTLIRAGDMWNEKNEKIISECSGSYMHSWSHCNFRTVTLISIKLIFKGRMLVDEAFRKYLKVMKWVQKASITSCSRITSSIVMRLSKRLLIKHNIQWPRKYYDYCWLLTICALQEIIQYTREEYTRVVAMTEVSILHC